MSSRNMELQSIAKLPCDGSSISIPWHQILLGEIYECMYCAYCRDLNHGLSRFVHRYHLKEATLPTCLDLQRTQNNRPYFQMVGNAVDCFAYFRGPGSNFCHPPSLRRADVGLRILKAEGPEHGACKLTRAHSVDHMAVSMNWGSFCGCPFHKSSATWGLYWGS